MIYPTPKIKSGATTVIFSHSYCDPVFNDPQVLVQRSPLTGFRNYVSKGDRSNYTIFIHIEKYNDPQAALLTLYGFYGVAVDEFYIDENDTDPIKNINGQPEKFIISSLTPVYLENTDNYSAVIMRLDSQQYVMAPEPQFRYWQDEGGGFIVDEDGNLIIT